MGRINHQTYSIRRVKIFPRHRLHVQGEAVSASVFSERGLRMTASWPVILRPKARSTFAPRASLFRLSDFSAVGTNRCWVRGLFSRRSRPSCKWEMSAILGSPLGRLLFVRSEAASEGLPLMVENRFEFRFCRRLDLRRSEEWRMWIPSRSLGRWRGEGESYRLSHDGALRIKGVLTGHFLTGDVV